MYCMLLPDCERCAEPVKKVVTNKAEPKNREPGCPPTGRMSESLDDEDMADAGGYDGFGDADDPVPAAELPVSLEGEGGELVPLPEEGRRRARDQDLQDVHPGLQGQGQVPHGGVPLQTGLLQAQPAQDGAHLGREGDAQPHQVIIDVPVL